MHWVALLLYVHKNPKYKKEMQRKAIFFMMQLRVEMVAG